MAKKASHVVSIVGLAAFGTVLAAVSRPPERSPQSPMTSINPLIGDESFFAAFGRWPGIDDDNQLRVRTHLAHVESRLRAVEDTNLSAPLRAARRRNLDLLRAYWSAGVFPAGENPAGRQPTFIDDSGRRCAVAALVEATAGTETVARINGRYRNAYIRQMDDEALAGWIAASGFTPDEVAMIQPNYDRSRLYYYKPERWQVSLDARAFYLFRLNGAPGDDARHIAGLKSGLRLIDLKYGWLAGARAAIGESFLGNHFTYDADLHVGYAAVTARPLALVFHAGGGVDGMTDVLPFGITVPFGLVISLDTSYGRINEHPAVTPTDLVLQLRAEGKWIAWGRDRPDEVAWTVGLDTIWQHNARYRERFYAKELIAGVFVTRFAGAVYGGVSLGLGFWSVDREGIYGADRPYLSPLDGPYN